MNGLTPLCPYCNAFSERVTGETIYPHREDLHEKAFFLCRSCDAYVGTHQKTGLPLGRLADAKLREWKVKAHNAFDPIWQHSPDIERNQAYHRLAKALGIPRKECHIGMFDVVQCQRTVEICLEGLLEI